MCCWCCHGQWTVNRGTAIATRVATATRCCRHHHSRRCCCYAAAAAPPRTPSLQPLPLPQPLSLPPCVVASHAPLASRCGRTFHIALIVMSFPWCGRVNTVHRSLNRNLDMCTYVDLKSPTLCSAFFSARIAPPSFRIFTPSGGGVRLRNKRC